MSLAVFFAFFGLYLAALPPALAPYRDAGEMASSALTLSVSHPPSYPLYVLLGRLAVAVPLGSPAYRLGLLSAAAAALAVAVVFAACARRWGRLAGLGAALLLGLNGTFWSIALVCEMYSLWLLAAAALLALALELRENYRRRLWLGFCLLFGLALTNRLDLLLWAPGLVWLALASWDEERAPLWASLCFVVFPAALVLSDKNALILPLVVGTAVYRYRGPARARWIAQSAGLGALGLAVYLYLPLRSARGPWLDWNHPAAGANFVESILRTRYGGTLDLLSKSYAKASQFGANMSLYGRHLWAAFGPLGLLAAAAGAAAGARRDSRGWLGTAAAWWWSGPVFLLMANMPPNPHAAAIVEPHYLASDLVLVFWSAEGLALIPSVAPAAAAAALLAVAPFGRGLWSSSARRDHLFSYDFAKNVLMSAPRGATIIVKKDVQLYTLWYYQLAHGWRPDARVVAQGLAGTPWYEADWRRRDPTLTVLALRTAADWAGLAQVDAPALASFDAEPPEGVVLAPRGLLRAPPPAGEPAPPPELMARRGGYDYEAQPDFFTADLVDDYAGAAYARGAALYQAGEKAAAERALREAWSMHWLYSQPPGFLGFMAFEAGDYRRAAALYSVAAGLAERLAGLAQEYRALPAVEQSMRRACAENLTQLGVAQERLGELEAAAGSYRRAVAWRPLARTHYNLAVLAWGKDWAAVESELEEALRLEPGNADVRRYLAAARARRGLGK